MPAMIVWIAVCIVSLYVLIQSSDYFTRAAGQIGLSFGMPDFMVGLTIVASGISLPEVVSSICAVLNNASQSVLGNVVGSNILTALAVMVIPALLGKPVIPHSIITFGIPMMLIASFSFSSWCRIRKSRRGKVDYSSFSMYSSLASYLRLGRHPMAAG